MLSISLWLLRQHKTWKSTTGDGFDKTNKSSIWSNFGLYAENDVSKYPKTEATFLKSKRVEISFYNKRLQLQQENLNDEWHEDILRAEFRCFKSYINDLYKRFDIDNITDFFEIIEREIQTSFQKRGIYSQIPSFRFLPT